MRWKRDGVVRSAEPIYKTPGVVGVWAHFTLGRPSDCWEWQGVRNSLGYGVFMPALNVGRTRMAHRLVYELHHHVRLPRGVHVLHHCDNPPCVNWSHMFVCVGKDNLRDMAP